MNLLLDVPRKILFIFVQYLDIHDITRLSLTSKIMRSDISECVREIYFSMKNMWTLVRDEEVEIPLSNEPDTIFRKRVLHYIYRTCECRSVLGGSFRSPRTPAHYYLTLPPISFLKRYPSLTKSNVPFLGTIEDLLEVDPTSLSPQLKLSVICTSSQIPTLNLDRGWSCKYWTCECRSVLGGSERSTWTPLPHHENRSLYARMKEWLVSFVLTYPDATLLILIIPEKNLLQYQTNFEFYYNHFSYSNRHVETTLPYVTKLVTQSTLHIGDHSFQYGPSPNTNKISAEQWLNDIDKLSTDDMVISVSDENLWGDINWICILLHLGLIICRLRDREDKIKEDFHAPSYSPMFPNWHDSPIKQKVSRGIRLTSHVPLIEHTENIPHEITHNWDMEKLRRLAIRYQKVTRRNKHRKERRLTLIPHN